MPPSPRIRLWPGIVAVALQWLVRYVPPQFSNETFIWGLGGAFLFGLVILLWWLFFSRVPHWERWTALAVIVAAFLLTPFALHESIRTGFQNKMFLIYALPTVSLGLVAGAALARNLSSSRRLAVVTLAVFAGTGFWTLLRTDGIYGAGGAILAWRWAPTAEERLVAAIPAPSAPAPTPAAAPLAPRSAEPQVEESAAPPSPTDWPGFRGPNRDGIVRGSHISADWTSTPPTELWRRKVGPGWSSFAVRGGLVYTQEQRGEQEVVACYKLATGEPVWVHQDKARFYESNGGPGPRSTPTLHGSRAYTFGATGILNALNAATGAVVWKRNAAADTGARTPTWGFSSSPLIVGDSVVVAAGGKLASYDLASGRLRWTVSAGAMSYSSPHLMTLDGVEQIVFLSDDGPSAISPPDGSVLWRHSWPGSTIIQPALAPDGGVLVTTSDMSGGVGMRRLALSHAANKWSVEEKWTSRGLKPYFNDYAINNSHAYGFDGSILSCIDLSAGERKWKGGRYGHGQLILLSSQNLMIVLSEEGEIALVSATPDEFKELGRIPALAGKTWNHPVLTGDILLVRNGEEMAAFRLAAPAR